MSTCAEYRVVNSSGLIAIIRKSTQLRLLDKQWRAVLAKYAEPERIAPQPTTLWRKLGLVTGYNYRDMAGFAVADGYKRRLDDLMPLHKVKLRNSILCNWAVREGYYQTWADAEQEFCQIWGSVEEKDLIDAWVAFCKVRKWNKL